MTRSAAKRSNASARLIAFRAMREPQLVETSVLRNGAFTAELSRDFVNRRGWQRPEMNWPYLAAMLNQAYRKESGEGTVRPRSRPSVSDAYPLLVANGEYHTPFERVTRRPSRAERDFPIDGYSAPLGYYDQP